MQVVFLFATYSLHEFSIEALESGIHSVQVMKI